MNISRVCVLEVVQKWTDLGAHLWYEEANSEAVSLYGGRAGVFLGMVAALSQRRPVGHDVAHAHWAMAHPDAPVSSLPRGLKLPWGESLSGGLPAACEAASLIREGVRKHPSGPKVGAFSRCLQLDPAELVAVVDVHVSRPMFGRDTPTDVQRREATETFLSVGRLLWGPKIDDAAAIRRAQAAFWHGSATQSGWRGGPPEGRSVQSLSFARLIRALDGWWVKR